MSSNEDESELPLYKDKPYNYGSSRRGGPFWRNRKLIGGVAAFVFLILFFSGTFKKIPTQKLGLDDDTFKKPLSNLLGGMTSPSFAGTGSSTSSSGGSNKNTNVDWNERREAVRDAFRISWNAYEKYAWGFDEFHPKSQTGRQMVPPNGMGWIIVDALDTMMIMNLTKELTHAREWVSTTLNYDIDHDVSTFETTIRMLGGLLGAHYLQEAYPNLAPLTGPSSKDKDLYLEKATDLADRLLGAYDSQSGVPFASVNLHTRKGLPSHEDGGASSTAEAASLQLEMKYLAKLTGEKSYWDAAEKIMNVIDDNGMKDGLLPIFIYADQGQFRGNNIRLGSRGDSYYEYLIKQHLQTNEPIYLDMWNEALTGMKKHLITYTKYANLTVLAERQMGLENKMTPKMDHLVCFMPGTIALGATGGRTLAEARKDPKWSHANERDMDLARELTKTCWGMYQVTATGLSPEITYFRIHDPPIMWDMAPHASAATDPETPAFLTHEGSTIWREDFDIHPADFHNMQRPETVETLLYMYRITGDQKYRDWGWSMFESFVQYTGLPDYGGFSSIFNVDHIPTDFRDNMESYWLAETLKYLYLLFSDDDLLPLDQVVFNTEAHPMPKFEMGRLFSTGWSRKPRDRDGNMVGKEGVHNSGAVFIGADGNMGVGIDGTSQKKKDGAS